MKPLLLLIQPAACVAWGLLLIILLSAWRRQWKLVFLSMAVLAFYSLVAGPLGANMWVNSVEIREPNTAVCQRLESEAPIVVLTGGMQGAPTEEDAVERLHSDSFRRTVAGVRLAQTRPASVVYFSGGGSGLVTEAALMSRVAQAFGLPEARIRIEQASRNTYESAVNIGDLLKVVDTNEIYLVTSALHMRRAINVFEAQGLQVCAVPTDSRFIDVEFSFFGFLPQVTALDKTTAVVHEILGRLVYKLRGYY